MSIYSKFSTSNEISISLLKNVKLFERLNDAHLEEVAAHMTNRQFAYNVTLFHQGMSGTMLYLIEKGSVRVFGVGITGQEHTFNTFSSGDVFGELSVFDGKARTASAITLEETTLWMLSKDNLERLWQKYPAICRAAIDVLAGRVRTAATHVESIIFQDVLGRLAYHLLNLAERHGNEIEKGIEIGLPLSQTDLASIVGATRESVNRALTLLRNQELIEIDKTTFWVLDAAGLLRIVQQRGR